MNAIRSIPPAIREEIRIALLCLGTGCGLACVFLAIHMFLSVVAPR